MEHGVAETERESVEVQAQRYVEDAHGLRLMALLEGMVREHGVKQAAEQLGVDARTLAVCLRRRRLTDHVRVTLGRQLEAGSDRLAQQVGGLAGRVEHLERQVGDIAERVTALAGEVDGLRSSVARETGAMREERAGAMRVLERRLAQVEAVQRGGPGTAGGPKGAAASGPEPEGNQAQGREYRRTHPKVVTAEAEYGEEEVYGDAEPLVIAWREARTERQAARDRLEHAEATERQMSLEIALMEGHGLTLAPERDPFDSLTMHSELKWRRQEVAAARLERRRALRRRWFRRLLTLGFWWE